MGNGKFFDRKGREFKTLNTVFIFINKETYFSSLGFTNEMKKKENMLYDLTLDNIKVVDEVNPYVELFKYKGFDISFDEVDFNQNPIKYKKALLNLVKKHNKGKYFLFYNTKSEEIEIIAK